MTNLSNILSARNTFFATLAVAALILAFLAPKAAINVDEILHYPHAKKVVNWYFSGGKDTSCLNTPVHNLKYYGQSVDNFTALINRIFSIKDEFLTRHYTGACFFLFLLLFSGLIGKELSGSYWVAVIIVIFTMLTPRLFGQAFGNLKDIPFAAGYVAGIFFILKFLKELPHPKWSSAVWLAMAIAFTCSVRVGGLILFGYFGLGLAGLFVLKPFLRRYIMATKSCVVSLIGQMLLILLIGYFAGLLFWPYALQNVLKHPLESLSVMEHYKVSIKQIFQGEVIWSSQLPWNYLPKWIAISSPEFLILGFIYFLVFLAFKFSKSFSNQLFFELFLLFTLAFPIVYVIAIGSNLYSGIRQMLFVIPILVILASLGFYAIITMKKRKVLKLTSIMFGIILLALPFKHLASTFPVDYVYFNNISGGNKTAWSNYEYDYYYHSMKEATGYLLKEIGEQKAIVAMNCQLSNYFDKTPHINYKYTRYLERSMVDWDYGLFGINYIHPYQLKQNTWQSDKIIKTFYHKGNPILVLMKRGNKNDLNGFEQIKNRNWNEGEKILLEELKTDSNNVWIYVTLANIKLAQNKTKEFDVWLKKGRAIHPYYEPFYLLEAQKFYNQQKYNKAYAVLTKLMKVNPRYKNAAPLLKKVKERLNK